MPYTTLLATLLGHLSLMCECEWRFVHTIQNVKLFLSFRFVEWPDSDPTSAPAATARPDTVSTSSLSLHGSSVYDVNTNTNTLLRYLRGTKTSHVVGPLDIITHARSSNSSYRVTARKKSFSAASSAVSPSFQQSISRPEEGRALKNCGHLKFCQLIFVSVLSWLLELEVIMSAKMGKKSALSLCFSCS